MSVNSKMKAIADPLRELSGTSAPMSLDDMATRAQEAADETDTQADLISQIVVALSGKGTSEEGGNVLLQSKTAEPSESAQKIEADTGYDGLSSVTIGAVSRTYIGSGVTKKAAQTYTPGTTSQTIASGQYLSGTQTIKGDADLAPENIRVGVEIFGVSGTYAGEAAMLQDKSVTPSKSEQSVTPDSGYDGLSQVTVNPIPDEYIIPSGMVTLTANGEHDVRSAEKAIVEVESPAPALQEKTARPMANGQTIRADDGYDGLGVVYITGDADLVASNIRSGIEIFGVGGTYTGEEPVLQSKSVAPTTSEQSITPDSGYDGLSKVTVSAMPTATQATPSISLSSAGVITASATQTAGYVTAGTKSATKQLTTQAAKTVTPGTSDQTAVSSGVYTTGAVKVRGDANLKAENIRSGVSIFDVLGTFEGEGGGSAGLPEGVSAMAYGTFVPAADVNTEGVEHGLGVRPDFCVWWLDDAHSVESGGSLRGVIIYSGSDSITFNVGVISSGYNTDGTFELTRQSVQGTFYMNATRFYCFTSSNAPLKAGYTYHWIAGVLDTAL